VAHLGTTDETDRVRVGLLGKTPFGRGRIKYEWEIKALGDFLDGDQTEVSPNWIESGLTGFNGEMTASSLREGWPYHWRVRVLYNPVSVPWQSHGRWLTVPRNGLEEADLRTGCGSVAPSGGTNLTLSKTGDARLTWDPVTGATRYDIVSGPILFLRDTFGNFRLASTRCLGNDIGDTTTTDAQIPPVGDGYWYLVRGVSCSGVATYDSGAPSQQGSRDSEINDANPSCP
jgi:hypothetical protein